MDLKEQISFKEDKKAYLELKKNSYYFKELNRGVMDYKSFVTNMKILNHDRGVDKVNQVLDNLDLVGSLLDILK